VPSALRRDVIVVLPSIEGDSVELAGARVDGGWMMQRTRRNGADLGVHARRIVKFFRPSVAPATAVPLAPIVFSWLAQRGTKATRLDPHDAASARVLAKRLAALFRDERLFHERLEQC
jgi:hypothetical protein